MKRHAVVLFVLVMSVAQAATVTIDVSRTGAPISKYLYGQFIEHLGRCIYGGLWAEMLEDRKFYYPVDGEAPAWVMYKPGERSYAGEGHPYELLVRSPWMIIGEKHNVRMITAGSYVGEHTPAVTLPGEGKAGGLMQERLGLIAGREYTGRIVLAGAVNGTIEVALAWGGGATMRDTAVIENVTSEYVKYPLRFRAGGSTDNGRLEIYSRGNGSFRIGTVSLMPADNVGGWRADTVALLKELNSPVYRWPGGNFVSGYDWKDGIGDRDQRPPRKNPAWKGVEHNDVGVHEYMALMHEIGAEAFVSVNTGLGDARAAAAEVEYLNGSATTPMGRLRAKNGHPKPWGVRWFAVGNEMYGDWQLGHLPLSEYVKKHNRVVDAMREVDPNIKAIAVGRRGEWSETMLAECGDHMTLLSEHVYRQNKEDLAEHAGQIAAYIRKLAGDHREYRKKIPGLAAKDIRIAMDEWNYWYGPNDFGELGTRYFVQDGLGVAEALHEFFRQSDIYFMANYAQTVNVIGAIKTTQTAAEFETTGLVLKLYRERYGTVPVAVSGAAAPLDVAAAWNGERTAITVGVVNPSKRSHELTLELEGAALVGSGRRWVIAGKHRMDHNQPGEPRTIDIVQTSFFSGAGELAVDPLSVTIWELAVQ